MLAGGHCGLLRSPFFSHLAAAHRPPTHQPKSLLPRQVQLPLELILFHVLLPIAIERMQVRRPLSRVLRWWLTSVAERLGLADQLLRRSAAAALPPGPLPPPPPPPARKLKFGPCAVLYGLSWTMLALAASAGLLVPLTLGRHLQTLASWWPRHDLYSFLSGAGICWCLGSLAAGVHQALGHWHHVQRWLVSVARCAVLAVLLVGVAPLLLGSLFEQILVLPFRVPIDEVAATPWVQNWAIGLVFLKIWVKRARTSPANPSSPPRQPRLCNRRLSGGRPARNCRCAVGWVRAADVAVAAFFLLALRVHLDSSHGVGW